MFAYYACAGLPQKEKLTAALDACLCTEAEQVGCCLVHRLFWQGCVTMGLHSLLTADA